jgi:hypothetical protein
MLAQQRSRADSEAPPSGDELGASIAAEPSESRLDIDSLSVNIPTGWVHEVSRSDRGSTLLAYPPAATGPPPINLVVKWSVPSNADFD